MHEQLIANFNLKDDPQHKMTMSELMTFALLPVTHFQCD